MMTDTKKKWIDSKPGYTSWCSMRQRCLNPNFPFYKNYGGRGIKICKRWMSYANFIEDMGPKPPGYSIERIDVNKGYNPRNCKWIPKRDQSTNRRDTHRFKLGGKNISTMEALSKELNLPYHTIRGRLRRGMTVEQIIEAGSPRLHEVMVGGVLFKNKIELCKHFGITYDKLGTNLYVKKMSLEEAVGLADV